VNILDDDWKKVADNAVQCLKNFYTSETFDMLKELPSQMWLEVEDFSSFYLDQTKIWAVLDCSFRTDDGITIIDWKTGKSTTENVSLQLACYAMYGMEKWEIEPEKIKLIEYNLLANQAVEFFITPAEIENAKEYILGSISDMHSLLVDAENNVPKEEKSFQKVEDERMKANCNFRKVCD
jgi:CRISPR/Cas system-associated exonuclease Cas4 (RecB family)